MKKLTILFIILFQYLNAVSQNTVSLSPVTDTDDPGYFHDTESQYPGISISGPDYDDFNNAQDRSAQVTTVTKYRLSNPGDYEFFVVALVKLEGQGVGAGQTSFAQGTLNFVRANNLSGKNSTFRINCAKLYGEATMTISMDMMSNLANYEHTILQPCTFIYEGIKYGGLCLAGTVTNAPWLGSENSFMGTIVGMEAPLLIPYVKTNTNEILNREIYNSLVVNGSDIKKGYKLDYTTLPVYTNTFDLGHNSFRWRNIYSNGLNVNGIVQAREVKIEIDSNWADFVFDKDYRLPSLREVESHINDFGHLPGIPSEKEVYENGINMAEMTAKLLQKIEELTLYVIDLKKENEVIRQENQQIKQQLNGLEKQEEIIKTLQNTSKQ